MLEIGLTAPRRKTACLMLAPHAKKLLDARRIDQRVGGLWLRAIYDSAGYEVAQQAVAFQR
jgi:hypothetical protein